MKPWSIAVLGCLLGAGSAAAQQPPIATPNPNYATFHFETDVNRPAQEVWARVGGFCAIANWWPATCKILSGKDEELGATRQVNTAVEILVAKTDLSYTYTQPVRTGAPYNLYHDTIEVKPLNATASRIVYSLIYDVSMLSDDARAKELANRQTRFQTVMQNLKTVAEGGVVSSPAGRQ
jgi:hypothetical protein